MKNKFIGVDSFFLLLFLLNNVVSLQAEMKEVFEYIADINLWHSDESISGTGSTLEQTEKIRGALPLVFKQFGIKTFLDAPCGDFHWMKEVDLGDVTYIGADIVNSIIELDRTKYLLPGKIDFFCLDLSKDLLPKVDCVFCRDCLVHFSYEDIKSALLNIVRSKSKYLITTIFPKHSNFNIMTGEWRPLNLTLPPFNFPEPELLINEGCTESDEFKDKSLGVWKIKDIEELLI